MNKQIQKPFIKILIAGDDSGDATIAWDFFRNHGIKVIEHPYGFTIHPDDGYPEWQITIQFTGRQDFNTAWMVTLIMVDGNITFKQGLTHFNRTDAAINKAIYLLTEESNFVEPINS
jgi:hypothetical protein